MTFKSSIMKKMNTLFDKTIYITFGCAMHLDGHRNKMGPLMKLSTLVNFSNGLKFLQLHLLVN
jgi:hypothetical protein